MKKAGSGMASNQEIKAPSNKRTTTGCSCSSTGGSVVKPLRQLPYVTLPLSHYSVCFGRKSNVMEMSYLIFSGIKAKDFKLRLLKSA
jgi:hypothetical protein